MKVGTQHGDSDDVLRAMAAFGVNNICSRLPSAKMDDAWSVAGLTQLKERIASFGISLDMVPLPLSSNDIARSENPGIMLANADRDRQLDDICQMIRNAARAGIPSLKYNMTFLGVPRVASTPGRGGARYSTFVYDEAKQEPPLTEAGPVGADLYWERITYFLERVIPVAEEYKVKMACHPNDSMTPPEGYQGVNAVLSTPDGLKKFVSIKESPYHGLNLCIGTLSEMLMDPGREVFDHIRWFGTRKKIFNIHFRNIKGGWDHFMEVSVDDGDTDMVAVMFVAATDCWRAAVEMF